MESQYDLYKRDIVLWHQEMKQLTLAAKVPEKVYDSVLLDMEDYSEEELKDFYEWLKAIYENPYKYLKYVWSLLSEEMWEKYAVFGMKNTREQNMLKEARRVIKIIWEQPWRSEKQKQRIKNKKSPTRHKGF